MFEQADPDYVRIVNQYLESQQFILTHENSMDCSLWRSEESEDQDVNLLGDGKILFIENYKKGKYQEIERSHGMSGEEISSAVEAMVVPLADPSSYETFTIEELDRISVEPGGGIVISYTVLCLVDQDTHLYILVKDTDQ
ncbi:hypothetical protein [Xanthomonas prunicola]|uniref:Uncharacterized protein n=1 Tax=Xanthomonas prunicola TaxID=2053930 RepID=A0A2N3RPX6_9XANT|nr:hypothetical protein [Xanthomonas prunicola]PKV14547.1 hypothetical protein XpruCFBP8353_05795 [Xanthomonas prunicola]PKV18829.1 hypothetical protein XpruCFBP8354_05795 [Xanthomonas prunicola]PKV21861.1 hypothetical protein CVO74_00660 [Xanthomonas prunicola]